MFLGFLPVSVGGNIPALLELSGVPANPDATPTFRVYGQSGFVGAGSGSLSAMQTMTITGATNTSPIVITSNGHGLTTGTLVRISGVTGNTAANGLFLVTSLTANTFSIPVAGNGAYVSGGTALLAGLYSIPITGSMLSNLAEGSTYLAVVSWAESAVGKTKSFSFGVV
jgi:hypothetical protein